MSAFPPDRLPSLLPSLVRTIVPIVAGAVIAWLCARAHVVLPPGASATAGAVLTGTAGSAYYALARFLERTRGHHVWQRACRSLGKYLLGGLNAQPVYRPTS